MRDRFDEWLANRTDDTPPPMLSDGSVVGDFMIVGFLGRGGSGEVYRAEHRRLKFPAAVKVLHHGDETGAARFKREAEILASHPRPGFPRFMAYGESGGRFYLATELLEERPLPTEDAAVSKFICRIAAAVAELHRLGYVHRDIKPSNILWRKVHGRFEPVLIDLGLAKPVADSRAPSIDSLSVDGAVPIGVGTPGYAAPEQFAGGDIDFSVDIHALGVLANACFDGNPPAHWREIIDSATSSIPARRHRSVSAFLEAVNRVSESRLLRGCIAVSGAIPFGACAVWFTLVLLSPLMPAAYRQMVCGTASFGQELAAILVAMLLMAIIPVGIVFRRNWARRLAVAVGWIYGFFLLVLPFADAEHGYSSFSASARLVLFFWWIPRLVTAMLLLAPNARTIAWRKRGSR